MSESVSSDVLCSIPLFEGFSQPALDLLAGATETISFVPGNALLREGEPNEMLFYLRSGRLKVRRSGDPSEVVITECEPGSVFGEMTFLEPGNATATVSALKSGDAIAVHASVLPLLERETPADAAILYKRLALALRHRLAETTTLILAHTGIREAFEGVEELKGSLGRLLGPSGSW